MRWIGGEAGDRDAAVEHVERWISRWERDGVGPFSVLLDGHVIGRVGLLVWDTRTWETASFELAGAHAQPELGWAIAQRFWGHGYATEAARRRARVGVRRTRRRAARLADRARQRPLGARRREARRGADGRDRDASRPGARLGAPAMTEFQPLAGIRVVDVTASLAGPTCTQLLAAFGADVVKIEPPEGDHARAWGPPFVGGDGALFFAANAGKRSLVLDLRHEIDQLLRARRRRRRLRRQPPAGTRGGARPRRRRAPRAEPAARPLHDRRVRPRRAARRPARLRPADAGRERDHERHRRARRPAGPRRRLADRLRHGAVGRDRDPRRVARARPRRERTDGRHVALRDRALRDVVAHRRLRRDAERHPAGTAPPSCRSRRTRSSRRATAR